MLKRLRADVQPCTPPSLIPVESLAGVGAVVESAWNAHPRVVAAALESPQTQLGVCMSNE